MTPPRRPREWTTIAVFPDAVKHWQPVARAMMTIDQAPALVCAGRLDVRRGREQGRWVYQVKAAEPS